MDQHLSTAEIICNRCGSRPEITTTDLGSMYKGVRCNECKKIECLNCKGLPPDRPCSWCGGKVSPIGYVNEPVSTGVSHSVKCPHCTKEIDENAFACPHCGRAVIPANQAQPVEDKENQSQKDYKHYDKKRGLEITAKPISLDRIYYPGDLVQTAVTVNCTKNSSVKGITASLGLYQPPGDSILNRITGLPIVGHSLLDGRSAIVTQALIKGGKLQAGFSESYEVEIRIPEDITPSFIGASYFFWISETPPTDWGINIIAPIKIGVPPPSQDFDPFARTVTGKNLEIILELPSLHWVLGEKIRGKIKVLSLKPNNGPINVGYVLRLEVDKGGNSLPLFEEIATESLANKITIPFGEVAEYDFELAIPTNLPPTLNFQRYSVEWELHVSAGTGVFSNTSCSQIIYVYSVPARKKSISQPAVEKINGVASPVASAPTKTCPKCAEKIMIEALVCRFCGHQFTEAEVQATKQQLEAQTQEAKRLADEEAALRKVESKKKSRQSWGWIMAISGGLSTLIGGCLFLIFLLPIIYPATFSETSETPVTISTFLCCPLPVLLIGGALIFFGIRIIRSGKNLQESNT